MLFPSTRYRFLSVARKIPLLIPGFAPQVTFACESLGSLGCFSTIIFCVVHVISHMVTLSLPFCLLYLCSVFKVQFRALLRVTLCLMAYVFLAVSPRCFRSLVGSSGLEPPTSRLSGVRSNHLSYEPMFARTFGRRPLSGPWWR